MGNTESKVFMIIGKSYSGKDTLLENILSDKKFCKSLKLERLVRYTNRNMRDGEEDGKTYHFVSEAKCEQFRNNDKAVITSFESKFGLLHYIADLSELKKDKNYILAGDPESIEPYKNILGEDRLVVIYLMPPNWEIFRRFSERDDINDTTLKYKEIYRRFMDDIRKFSQSNDFLAGCHCIIHLGKDYSIDDFKTAIKNHIKTSGFTKTPGLSILLHKGRGYLFNNNYHPHSWVKLSYNEIVNGDIIFANGNLILNTEEEYIKHSENRFLI
jgi:guanylate kinase